MLRVGEFAYREENDAQVRAFNPTSSSSPRCLMTLGESANAAVSGTTLYCGTRNYTGMDGLFVHVFLPARAPPALQISIILYQEGAKAYGTPVLYPAPLQ